MGELQYKVWLTETAQREGVCRSAIAMRVSRGGYPGLKRRTVHARLVYVSPTRNLRYYPKGEK